MLTPTGRSVKLGFIYGNTLDELETAAHEQAAAYFPEGTELKPDLISAGYKMPDEKEPHELFAYGVEVHEMKEAAVPFEETPLVLSSNFELIRVLAGNELAFSTDKGERIRIRLATPEEMLESIKKAQSALGDDSPGLPSQQKLIELTTPVDITTLLR